MAEIFIQYSEDEIVIIKGKNINKKEMNIEYKNRIKIPDSKHKEEVIKDILLQEKIKLKNKKYDVKIGYSLRGILYREIQVPFMPIEDLGKMMELEIGEYLSVDKEEYECRFKVLDKVDNNGQLFWNLAVAGVEKASLVSFIDSLEEIKYKVKNVDILPNMYRKIFSKITKEDLMIVESCFYGCKICIIRDEKVFLYADIPLDNESMFKEKDFSLLVTEINGYLEYFASRNFGKNIDHIAFLGKYSDIDLKESVMKEFIVEVKDILTNEELLEIESKSIKVKPEGEVLKLTCDKEIEREEVFDYILAASLLIND